MCMRHCVTLTKTLKPRETQSLPGQQASMGVASVAHPSPSRRAHLICKMLWLLCGFARPLPPWTLSQFCTGSPGPSLHSDRLLRRSGLASVTPQSTASRGRMSHLGLCNLLPIRFNYLSPKPRRALFISFPFSLNGLLTVIFVLDST